MKKKYGLVVLLVGCIVYFLYWINQTPALKGSFSEIVFTDKAGKVQSIDQFRNHFVLIDLYASWCIDCIKVAPEFKVISDSLMLENWVVLGITDDDFSHIKKWEQKYQANYPIWHLEQHYKTMGVNEIPTYFVLDKNGKVVKIFNQNETDNFLSKLRKIKLDHE